VKQETQTNKTYQTMKAIEKIFKFSSLDLARSFANRAEKMQLVILGDDDKYWVASPRVTEKLHKEGYQYA